MSWTYNCHRFRQIHGNENICRILLIYFSIPPEYPASLSGHNSPVSHPVSFPPQILNSYSTAFRPRAASTIATSTTTASSTRDFCDQLEPGLNRFSEACLGFILILRFLGNGITLKRCVITITCMPKASSFDFWKILQIKLNYSHVVKNTFMNYEICELTFKCLKNSDMSIYARYKNLDVTLLGGRKSGVFIYVGKLNKDYTKLAISGNTEMRIVLQFYTQ